MTLRTKTTLYVSAGFTAVMAVVCGVLLFQLHKTLIASFDNQLRTKAWLVASKTSIQPRIIPLPESNDLFLILYRHSGKIDTLYQPAVIPFALPATGDSAIQKNDWRTVRIKQSSDNDGSIIIIYAASSAALSSQQNRLSIFILLLLLLGSIVSGVVSWYFISRFLNPVQQVIRQTNALNLHQNVALLPELPAKDEMNELIISFNRMLVRIKEQSDRQTAFFAAASHELRTPLTIMQTRLQVLLQAETLTVATKEIYQQQLNEVKQLAKMVNDFLLMSQLQSGAISTDTTQVELADWLPEIIASKKSKAGNRGLQFKLQFLPAEEDYTVITDAEKLEIIIGNLLDNTLKYGSENSIIEVSVSKIEHNITLEIKNTIRPDINPQLTDVKNAFYQAKPLQGEGFGLGLWITSQLAALQSIEFYCSISNGEIFIATLVL